MMFLMIGEIGFYGVKVTPAVYMRSVQSCRLKTRQHTSLQNGSSIMWPKKQPELISSNESTQNESLGQLQSKNKK